KRCWRPGACLLVLTLAAVAVRAVELDEVQSRLVAQYPLPLRWDNVQCPPEWVGGARPRLAGNWPMHVVVLAPGHHATLRLPPSSTTRLVRPDGPLHPIHVHLAVSDGSGLYVSLPGVPFDDGHGLLYTPEGDDSLLARVEVTHVCPAPLELGLFVSRYDP